MEYFDSKSGMYHYFVCPRDDYFITNTLEKLDYHEYLYRLLLDKGYTRIIFLDEINEFVNNKEIQGKRAFTFDEDSYEFYRHPRETTGKEQKLNTPKRRPDKEITLTEETIKYYKKISSKSLDDSERIGAEIVNHIIPTLQSKKERVAIIMSIDLIKGMKSNSETHRTGEVEYDLDKVLRLFNSAYEKQDLNNILIFTMKENGELKKFSNFFGMLRGLEQENFDAGKSDFEINLNNLKETKIYNEVHKEVGLDEITNLLLRKKMKLDDTDKDTHFFEKIEYSKIPMYAEYISGHLKKNTFPIKQCESLLNEEDFVNEMVAKFETKEVKSEFKRSVKSPYELERINHIEDYDILYAQNETEEEILAEFDRFYGKEFEDVKNEVIEALEDFEACQKENEELIARGLEPEDPPYMNMRFFGPPGTGKTAVSNLVARLFHAKGILPRSTVVKKDAIKLIGTEGHRGETEGLILAAAEEAKGGVLLIDEFSQFEGKGYKGGSVGKDACDTILTVINENYDSLCVIICGYEEPVNNLIKKHNEGLLGRFPNVIKFNDYSIDTLMYILHKALERTGKRLGDGAEEKIRQVIINTKKLRGKSFRNAGFIEKELIPAIRKKYRRRHTNDNVYTSEDVVEAFPEMRPFWNKDVENVENILSEFDKFYGEEFKNVKKEVLEALEDFEACKKENEELIARGFEPEDPPYMNMRFFGPPGTGKTAVSNLIARLFHAKGILPRSTVVKKDAIRLIGTEGHRGETEGLILAAAEEAKGGVLLIDEFSQFEGKGYKGGSVGKDAIDTILTVINENYDSLCVIICGYEEPVNNLIKKHNEGLLGRFPNVIKFNDYSIDTLMYILHKALERTGKRLGDGAEETIRNVIINEKIIRGMSFRNAGFVEKELIPQIRKKYRSRHAYDNIYTREDVINAFPISSSDVISKEVVPSVSNFSKDEIIELKNYYEYEKSNYLKPEKALLEKTEMSILYLEVEFGCHKGYGTGFFIHPDGYILTCNHVVKTRDGQVADKIVVRMRYPGRPGGEDSYHNCVVVKTFEDLDMALLKTTDGSNFPYLKLAQPEHEVKEFDEFILPGYPMGELTKTGLSTYTCKISSVQRNPNGDGIDRYNIQGEAKKGNSGSPAISLETGEVIGLLPGAIQAYEGDYEEINYLRPIKYFWERFFD